jgi:hypothetical protein
LEGCRLLFDKSVARLNIARAGEGLAGLIPARAMMARRAARDGNEWCACELAVDRWDRARICEGEPSVNAGPITAAREAS